jgi:hypothetical protein
MTILHVKIRPEDVGVFDASGRQISRQEQAMMAEQLGRPDWSDKILGISRPWHERAWRWFRYASWKNWALLR